MRFFPAIAFVLLLLAACGGGSSDPGATDAGCQGLSPLSPDTVAVKFTNTAGAAVRLVTQLSDTAQERSTGLMNRDCLPEDEGMIFAYHSDSTGPYWMKDTKVALTIAFIQADGKIVHIEDMQPETTNNHISPSPYRYAVEANRGWFADNGIAVGDTADIPPALSEKAEG